MQFAKSTEGKVHSLPQNFTVVNVGVVKYNTLYLTLQCMAKVGALVAPVTIMGVHEVCLVLLLL